MRTRVLPTLVVLSATLVVANGCSRAPEPPAPQARAQSAPVVTQGRPSEAELAAAALEVVDVQLRTGRTRVGEAVRLHVIAWRSSDGPRFEPVVELDGPATIERVGDEIVEEKAGRVRERVDFLVEPTGPGTLSLTVLATGLSAQAPAKPVPEATTVEAGAQRHDLTLVIGEALDPAELAKLLADQPGRIARGRALTQQGDYRRALEVYNLALEHQRDDPVVLTELGWAAFLATDYSLARRATREGLRHQPDPHARGALLYNLGRIAEALDRDDEAIAAYRRSLEVRPEAPTVRKRLATLEAANPEATCAGASCPSTPPVDAIRACELIEEEGCPLFRQRGACRCDADSLAELDPIGPWRLLTLTERAADPSVASGRGDGRNQVFFLLAEAKPEAEPKPDGEAEPARFHVFAPLPGSHFDGELRGGVRSAEQVAGETLRIDFEGTVPTDALAAEAQPAKDRLVRRWTLLCTFPASGPVCQAPLLTGYQSAGQSAGQPEYRASLTLDADGRPTLALESGSPPDPAELALEFPGTRVQLPE